MFVTFFHELKSAGVPVTLREYLTLMEAMEKDIASRRVDEFYYLSRAALVKDERNLDKFDRVFGRVFKGLEFMSEGVAVEIPAAFCAGQQGAFRSKLTPCSQPSSMSSKRPVCR